MEKPFFSFIFYYRRSNLMHPSPKLEISLLLFCLVFVGWLIWQTCAYSKLRVIKCEDNMYIVYVVVYVQNEDEK